MTSSEFRLVYIRFRVLSSPVNFSHFNFPTESNKMNVHKLKALNSEEQEYINSRKPAVLKCLKENGTDVKGPTPVIAVLGSGGGERAMVGLLGVLAQMGEEKMLDSILYLCGVSGSTWCMSSLYEDATWSQDFPSVKTQIVERLLSRKWASDYMLNYLEEAVDYENYSLTDFWAATFVYNIICEMDRSCLSEQKQRDPVNPYPIYTAIDKGLKQDGDPNSCWVEITPHQAGYTNLGAFVETSKFWSKHKKDQLIEQNKEPDMLYLQGLWGSALADGQENWEQVKAWIWDWISKLFGDASTTSSERYLADSPEYKILDCLINLHDFYEDDEDSVRLLQELMELMPNTNVPSIVIIQKDDWLKKTPEQRKQYVAEFSVAVCDNMHLWFRGEPGKADIFKVLWRTIPALYNWDWGTKFNFLYKTARDGLPKKLVTSKKRQLEDAGLLLNSPYMAALRSDRKVNLILSFDFSEGDPFLTVTKAAELCKAAGIPFPPVHVPQEEKNMPKDFYVFQDEGDPSVPTVIHIPLFNSVNCGDNVEDWRERYTTFQGPYERQMIEELLEKSALNVAHNKKQILDVIQRACLHE